MDLTYKSVEKEQRRLEDIRRDYESLKRLCTDLAYPERVEPWEYLYSAANHTVKGKKYHGVMGRIHDATAIKSFEIWADGTMGHYMPKDINWFTEEMADRDIKDSKNVIKWLQETDEHMRYTLNQSGGLGSSNDYYSQKRVSIRDAGCIGDSYLYIEEDRETGKLLFLTRHPREFWIRRDYWGRVVVIHHKTTYTAQQIIDEFGRNALSEDQLLKFDTAQKTEGGGPDVIITVIHGIYKNKDYEPEGIGVNNMPWQHVYVNMDGKKKILQTGSRTLNPVPWSLNRPSHEDYGRGIVAQMLIEILTANFTNKDLLIASQLAARPPMLIPAAWKNKLKARAGGKTYVKDGEMKGYKVGDLVARLIDSSGYPFGADMHDRWVNLVEARFGVDIFLALQRLSKKGDTAYKNIEHVRMVQGERAVLMAPFLGTLGNTTDLEFDRMYNIELNSRRAPEPPQEVLDSMNGRIDLQYIGPLTQLLKSYYETGNLLTAIAYIQQVLTVSPDSALVVEGDDLMRKILRSGNTPEDIILSKEDVMEIKAIAAQKAEEERAVEMAAKMAGAVPDLSKKIEKDSLLSELAA